jgi:hypothetical protein
MTPLHRLNSFMPLVVLTYLMMCFAQCQMRQETHVSLKFDGAISLYKDFENSIIQAKKKSPITTCDRTHCEIGYFIPP